MSSSRSRGLGPARPDRPGRPLTLPSSTDSPARDNPPHAEALDGLRDRLSASSDATIHRLPLGGSTRAVQRPHGLKRLGDVFRDQGFPESLRRGGLS